MPGIVEGEVGAVAAIECIHFRVYYLFFTKPMIPPVATKAPKAYPATSCFFMSLIVAFLKCTDTLYLVMLFAYLYFQHVCFSTLQVIWSLGVLELSVLYWKKLRALSSTITRSTK